MNKITVVKEKILTETDHTTTSTITYNDNVLTITKDISLLFNFDHSKSNFIIKVKPGINVKIISKNNVSINQIYYEIEENSSLDIFHLGINCSDSVFIQLNGENSRVNYQYSTINSNTNTHKLSIYHNKSNTESNVVNHGVNLSNDCLSFEVNGIVLEKSTNCICNQDNKIIVKENNTARIDPNLLIDNHDVEANHAAFIGSFKDSELFYLMSRGIPKEKCYELLLDGFLLGNKEIDKKIKDWFFGYLKNRR